MLREETPSINIEPNDHWVSYQVMYIVGQLTLAFNVTI